MQNETEFREILDSISDGFFSLKTDGTIIYFNKSAGTLLGVSPPDVIGKKFFEAFPETKESVFEEKYKAAAGSKTVTAFEAYFDIPPYENWYDIRIYPKKNGITVYFTVITETKANAKKLKEQQKLYRLLLRQYPNGSILVFDSSLHYIFAGGTGLKQLGYSDEDIIGNTLFDLTEKNLAEKIADHYRKAFTGEEDRFRLPFGGHIYDVHVVPVPEDDGEIKYGMSISVDVTGQVQKDTELEIYRLELEELIEEKTADLRVTIQQLEHEIEERSHIESELRKNEEKFRQLAENIRDVFWIRDLDGEKMLYISPSYEEIWGHPVQRLLDNPRDFMETVHPEDCEKVTAAYKRQTEKNEYFNEEYRIIRPDGSTRWVHARNWPVFDDEGNPYRIVGVAEDITVRKEMQQTLLHAKETAELANTMKTEFLANISHELKTPLHPILSMTEILQETELDDEQRDLLSDIEHSAGRLLTMINNLITLTRLESGDISARNEDFSIQQVLASVQTGLQKYADSKSLALTSSIGRDIPRILNGDQSILHAILYNVVENAVKFTDAGGVEIHVEKEPGEAGPEYPQLHFTIRDSGPGIQTETLDSLFSTFTQADASKTRKHGGLGIGLSIVREYVRLMNGGIFAENGKEGGTVFHIILPFS